LPELFDHCFLLLGTFLNCKLQILSSDFFRQLQLSASQGIGDADQDLIRLKGLQDISVDACPERGLGLVRIINGCDHDHGRIWMIASHLANKIETGHPGHAYVAEKKVIFCIIQLSAGLLGVNRQSACIAIFFEKPLQHIAEQGFIIDNEYLQFVHDLKLSLSTVCFLFDI